MRNIQQELFISQGGFKVAKLVIESITLTFITKEEKFFDKTIPFSDVCSLSFFDVRCDVGHTNDGEFLEFYTAW